jgi:hypothetical protein
MFKTRTYERLLATLRALEGRRSSRVYWLPRDVRRMVGDYLAWTVEVDTFANGGWYHPDCSPRRTLLMTDPQGVGVRFTETDADQPGAGRYMKVEIPHFKGLVHGTLRASLEGPGGGKVLEVSFEEGEMKGHIRGGVRSPVGCSQIGLNDEREGGGLSFHIFEYEGTVTLTKTYPLSHCYTPERIVRIEHDSTRIYRESWAVLRPNEMFRSDAEEVILWEMTTRWGEPLYERTLRRRRYVAERFFRRGLLCRETMSFQGGSSDAWTFWANGRVRDRRTLGKKGDREDIRREWRRNGSMRRMVKLLADGRREVTRYDVGGYPSYVVTLNRKGRRDGLLRHCSMYGTDEEVETWRNGRRVHRHV